jgi:CDP-diacylglycerol--glycerol-3-phosphate 3-phosphatidyltransferase
MRRDSGPAKALYRFLEERTLPFLLSQGITPDQMTGLGLLLSALAGLSFLVSPLLAALLAALGGLCDTADGLLARSTGRVSRRGAFLDSVLDRYGESFLFLGAWGHLAGFPALVVPGGVAVMAALAGSLMVSYTRARGEALGVSCDQGRFTRPERLLIMVAGGFFDFLAPGRIVFLAVLVVAAGANWTALRRFRLISRSLAEQSGGETAGRERPEV